MTGTPGVIDRETARAVLNRFPLLALYIAIGVPVFLKTTKNNNLQTCQPDHSRPLPIFAAHGARLAANNVAIPQRDMTENLLIQQNQ
ncbi:hypothetical protein Csal_0714 [Chromohalobacter israelensis DSM 3043]|uniref:Uncharacterized protein n=1 Tax=Chromohalobacter israelensis (strain ATCC BAA-138 / DSM 3043 / CIP 106854 / NCIMB 13768 / 1H11) TaxID=290398 RepID=Q1QZN3_CHRI1|nr:hypothetical protein Csal_0714 [Chromohalobacter salexigens DSM 3043]